MTHSIEHRLAALERQNQTLRRTVAAIAIAAGLAAALGAMGLARREPAPKVIEAQSFNLVDAAGKVRARLFADAPGPRLRFLDENGKNRTSIGYNDGNGPFIGLLDQHEKARIRLGVAADGCEIDLCDENEIARAGLAHSPSGTGLNIQDAAGKSRLVIGNTKDGPVVNLLDSEERCRMALVADGDTSSIHLLDAGGKGDVSLNRSATAAGLQVHETDGHVRATVGYQNDKSVISTSGRGERWTTALRSGDSVGGLVIEDDAGQERVGLGVAPDRTGLVIKDAGNKVRASLEHCPDCAALYIGDEKGNRRIETGYNGVHTFSHLCAVDKRGGIDFVSDEDMSCIVLLDKDRKKRLAIAHLTGSSAIHMYGDDGDSKVNLDYNNSAGSILDMIAPKSNAHVAIGTDSNRPAVALYDENDKARIVLKVHNPWAAMILYDATEMARAYLAASSEQAQVVLCDEHDKTIWQAPLAADTKGEGCLPSLKEQQIQPPSRHDDGKGPDSEKPKKLDLGPTKPKLGDE